MKRVLIIGAGKGGTALLKLLLETNRMEIVAIVDIKQDAPGLQLAAQHSITTAHKWRDWIREGIDIVIEATGSEEVLEQILQERSRKTVVIPGSVATITAELLEEKETLLHEMKQQAANRELILNHIHEGMIVINDQEDVVFVNRSAERIVGIPQDQFLFRPIEEIISHTRLPHTLRTRRKEVNQKLTLENGRKIITTRIPIIDAKDNLKGAFAIFRDITEVVDLAEELTDLKDVKTMLEAIIHSSDEAISVVDENGIGIMVNPAYTRITGLTEKEIVGKPATVDISEGESMHMKVLQTRRGVRGVRMKVGPTKKDVLVNVAPVIVDGKLKGSVGVLHDVTEIRELTSELKRARQIIRNLEAKYTFDDIIGDSNEMTLALEQAKVGARTPATVLLRGESGTGKELFAHAIHNESGRRHNKFIRVNCAAIAESILESELFGYEEGAFSGAKRGGKKGLFEEANNGSIFLDEIGELSLHMQAKLLRVLQENEIVRVGGTKPVTIDVRIITATNVNLEKAIMNGDFREDLYYRLNRLPIFIPALRERIGDLEELTNHLIQKINQDYGRNVTSISSQAISYLKSYHWPGNVRELENVLGRAMIYIEVNEEMIQRRHIPSLSKMEHDDGQEISGSFHWEGELSLQESVEVFEKQVITDAFEANGYNKTKTAIALGISIRNLYYKMDKYKIDKDGMQ
ncbi:sigma 54-interacting transcriptional regulator [Aquibacillus sp. 3ASR75-11]|uniref:Sigma 54-interacting transcriptional regulator n=1 Tax=Terrihalobacillus insolitus TaxID=2950438 RepID=A0A9X3WVH7_9BACI|nr:sigma 54-interacting transcriptional regulator [Terrihalobacillus insolitus]MDC3414448.1 sigma 54-interacting transcriptional regulator [Terrihalobacillus insolitus]MDC3425328.1 sigma 54-interacting transcriptional regulator [Terrihalobacillus insolitus]